MTDFRLQYKRKTLGFGNTYEGRLIRAEKHAEDRKERRAKDFSRTRDLREDFSQASTEEGDKLPKVQERFSKLEKWKAERDLRKKIEKLKKKPVFKVGIVHHSLGSPILQASSPHGNRSGKFAKKEPTPLKRVTRATERRLAAAAQTKTADVLDKRHLKAKHPKRKQIKSTVNKSKEDTSKLSFKPNVNNGIKSFAPENYKFKGPFGLPAIPLFGQAALQAAYKFDNEKESDGQTYAPSVLSFTSLQSDAIMARTRPLSNTKTVENNLPFHNSRSSLEKKNVKLDTTVPTIDTLLPAAANSSFEKITLNLSAEGLERLDCPRKGLKVDKHSDNSSSSQLWTNISDVPVFYSPYVVTSRGKSSARKEQKEQRGVSRSPCIEIPTKDTVMNNLNISVQIEEETAQYFKSLLNREVERLASLCTKWMEVKSGADIPEDARYQIDRAIEPTNLLMNKKLERFKKLVLHCETGKGQMLVTCRDLQGFWDMMYIEISDCDSRFNKLEELKCKGWVEEGPSSVEKDNKDTGKRALAKRRVLPRRTKSSTRNATLEARKQKSENEQNEDEIIICSKEQSLPYTRNSVQFDEGFIPLSSPRKTGKRKCEVSNTPQRKRSRRSLLKKVQVLGTEQSVRSPLAVMNVEQIYNIPEIKMDTSISYINSNQSPGKSILKRGETEDFIKNGSCTTKSICKVNFNDTVNPSEVFTVEGVQNKKLAAAITRIDSYDLEEDQSTRANINAERKLNFEDESFKEVPPEAATEEAETLKKNVRRSKRKVAKIDTPDEPQHQTINARRRSSRRSVRSTGNESTPPMEDKSVHPMTPRTRRSRTRLSSRMSLLGDTDVEFVSPPPDGDLISWDTPNQKPTGIIRRSRRIGSVAKPMQ